MVKSFQEPKGPTEDDGMARPAFWALEGYDDPDAFMAKLTTVDEAPAVVEAEPIRTTANISPSRAVDTDRHDADVVDEDVFSWGDAQTTFEPLALGASAPDVESEWETGLFTAQAIGQAEEENGQLARRHSICVARAETTNELSMRAPSRRAQVTPGESFDGLTRSPFSDDEEEERHDEAHGDDEVFDSDERLGDSDKRSGVRHRDALIETHDEDQRRRELLDGDVMDEYEGLDVSPMQRRLQAEDAGDWEDFERSDPAKQRGRWLLGLAARKPKKGQETSHALTSLPIESEPADQEHVAPIVPLPLAQATFSSAVPLVHTPSTAIPLVEEPSPTTIPLVAASDDLPASVVEHEPLIREEPTMSMDHTTSMRSEAPLPLLDEIKKTFVLPSSWGEVAEPAATAPAKTAGVFNLFGYDVPRRTQYLVIGAVPVVILAGALGWRALQQTPPARTNATTAAPPILAPRTPFTPVLGSSLVISSILAGSTELYAPREAAALGANRIAVVDAGHARTVILDMQGRLLTTLKAARPGERPVALSSGASYIYVLDAASGSIDRYTKSGIFFRTVITNPLLKGAQGMVLGPNKMLYVANPATNQITTIDGLNGQILRQIEPARGSGKGNLDGPIDVSVTRAGSLYVLDSGNDRIEKLRPNGAYITQWATPHSTADKPVHVLVLPNGRVAATDPSGALLVYPRGGGIATRHTLTGAGPVQPLGLSLAANGEIIVVDAKGGRLLWVALPR